MGIREKKITKHLSRLPQRREAIALVTQRIETHLIPSPCEALPKGARRGTTHLANYSSPSGVYISCEIISEGVLALAGQEVAGYCILPKSVSLVMPISFTASTRARASITSGSLAR